MSNSWKLMSADTPYPESQLTPLNQLSPTISSSTTIASGGGENLFGEESTTTGKCYNAIENWFAKSFRPSRLHGGSDSGNVNASEIFLDNDFLPPGIRPSVKDLRKNFERSPPLSRRDYTRSSRRTSCALPTIDAVPNRKVTIAPSTSDEEGEWDFLSKLTEILSETSFMKSDKNELNSKKDMNWSSSSSPPLRPPRPLRRRGRHGVDYSRTRSMDAAEVLRQKKPIDYYECPDVDNYFTSVPPPMPLLPSANRNVSQKSGSPFPRNNLSSSLDSIVDQLNNIDFENRASKSSGHIHNEAGYCAPLYQNVMSCSQDPREWVCGPNNWNSNSGIRSIVNLPVDWNINSIESNGPLLPPPSWIDGDGGYVSFMRGCYPSFKEPIVMAKLGRSDFSQGFEPLIVTEEETIPRKRTTESDEDGGQSSSDVDEKHSSSSSSASTGNEASTSETLGDTDSTEHYCVSGLMTLNIGTTSGSGSLLNPSVRLKDSKSGLRKMCSYDFQNQEKGLTRDDTISQDDSDDGQDNNDGSDIHPKRSRNMASGKFIPEGKLVSSRMVVNPPADRLPPIPPSVVEDPSQQSLHHVKVQSVRTQVGSSRLRSPSRQGSSRASPQSQTTIDEALRSVRRYASSLPDNNEKKRSSPTVDDFQGLPSSELPTPCSRQHCKNKHSWERASLERDLFGSTSMMTGTNNRHSSYHPSIVDEAAAAAAAAVAHKFTQMVIRSRPSSPCGGGTSSNDFLRGEFTGCCGCGGNYTVPRRVRATSACHCCQGIEQLHNSHRCNINLGSRGSLLGLDLEDRLLRLESDKDTLHLQVSVLSEQIDAQTSKIHDLEKLLDDKKNVLESTQDTLSRELLTRSSLETQKLELLTEISSLRLKQASLERENFDLKDRFGLSDLSNFGDIRLWSKPPMGPGMGHMRSPSPTLTHQNGYIENGSQRSRLGSTGSELMSPIASILPAKAPSRPRTPPANAYRRVDQSAFGTLPRRNQSSSMSAFNNGMSIEPETKAGSTKGGSISIGNLNTSSSIFQYNQGSSYMPSASALATPPTPTKKINPLSFQLQHKPYRPYHHHPSFSQCGSIIGGNEAYFPASNGIGELYTGTDHGPRSTSAPNLAVIEREEWGKRNQGTKKKSPGPSGGGSSHKSRGILRILSKLKRSNSCGLDDDVAPESNHFTRGGFRATAAPRLGWVRDPSPLRKPDGPIHLWDSDAVILWLSYLGLAMYSTEVRRWVKSGQQLLDATNKELEKELGIKNPLHRKKLSLAINSLRISNEEDNPGRLDYHWVIRWLDDIGLPQYKETFGEARVDGRVLSHLTAEDLVYLKVTNLLHHMSIKRGIQLLRIFKFHPGCICRRGIVGRMKGNEGSNPEHIATWSNHRVMEWLRTIELAEYAPNLRGSGVHGALIILEPKFNSDLLATLLSIPPDKTLLRRHVNQEVNEILGRYLVQEKRKIEMSPDFVPLSPTLKVKIGKSMKVFHLRKKRTSSTESEELLCPETLNSFPYQFDSKSPVPESPSGSGKDDLIAIITAKPSSDSSTNLVHIDAERINSEKS